MLEPIWAWGILGLILIALEMLSGTLYILWFGIAALCLSLLAYIFPAIDIAWQLLIFTVLALGSLILWRQFYKKETTDSNIGQSRGDEIGRIGTITQAVSSKQNGRIEFAQGVLGSRDWVAIANEEIEAGADAIVVAVEGNRLRVTSKT
ncbi:NfeD family protein [Methylobacillus gramineus]|uniref:NfeD family protein n=1 Tax=Methylobacillus gramineus TaxID=755169 RepID=UPI001CFFE57A|nr:NfeD family protein [Methylobacillus gramineus]MCB5185451.1 NfeD family protein [Methylobacillus gramineus]